MRYDSWSPGPPAPLATWGHELFEHQEPPCRRKTWIPTEPLLVDIYIFIHSYLYIYIYPTDNVRIAASLRQNNGTSFWRNNIASWIQQTWVKTQRTYDAIITSLLRQNDVAASFWRNNDVIIAARVRWEPDRIARPDFASIAGSW